MNALRRCFPRPLPSNPSPIRPLSSSSHPPNPKPPPFWTPRTLDRPLLAAQLAAYKSTLHPSWLLLNRLTCYARRLPFVSALSGAGVRVDDFRTHWAPSACAPDTDSALAALRVDGKGGRAPTWLVLHVLCHLPKSAAQAQRAAQLALAHLPRAEPVLAPWLLVLTTHVLARYRLLAQLAPAVDAFLLLAPTPPSAQQFNHLLAAIARFPRAPESARQALRVLDAMRGRQIPLSPRTCKALLHDDFLTLALAKRLHEHMHSEGTPPTLPHLAGFLRVYARAGRTRTAGKYLDAIHDTLASKPGAGRLPLRAEPGGGGDGQVARRWNTLYLSSFRTNTRAALVYLRCMLAAPTPAQLAASSARAAVRSVARRGSSVQRSMQRLSMQRPSIQRSAKNGLDAADWSTALSICARDARAPPQALLKLFAAVPAPLSLSPFVRTALVRGLLQKRAWAAAGAAWDDLAQPGVRLDRVAMSVGVRALVCSGRSERAVALLTRPHRPVDAVALNAFISALLEVGRPDGALAVWDAAHHSAFREVRPDAVGLALVMRAAREVGARAGVSVSGALRQMGDVFGSATDELDLPAEQNRAELAPAPTRAEAIRALRTTLAAPLLISGAWRGAPAWATAARTFRAVLLGNWPHLARVRGPVQALRRNGDDVAGRPWRELVHVLPGFARAVDTSFEDDRLVPDDGAADDLAADRDAGSVHDAAYAHLVPTDAAFRAYLLLLVHAPSRAPTALAWMRALSVRPQARTLALALVLFADVALGAPWARAGVGAAGPGQSRYEALVRWMTGWVGVKGMPGDGEVRWAMREVARVREGVV